MTAKFIQPNMKKNHDRIAKNAITTELGIKKTDDDSECLFIFFVLIIEVSSFFFIPIILINLYF
jgi:hypothetical protein